MKNWILFMVGLFANFILFGQETKQTVKISNLKNIKGNLYIAWYNQSSTFRVKGKAIYREKVFVNNQEEITVYFMNIPKGKYAIAVFLDENDNLKLDKNLFGIPKEKYGFSNNILPIFRPATFEESVFELNHQEININIILK